MKRILIVLICAFIALAFLGCAPTERAEPSASADSSGGPQSEPEPMKLQLAIDGTIEAMEETEGGVTLTVKAISGTNSVLEKAAVLVSRDTSIGEYGVYYFEDPALFAEGMEVRVFTDGSVAESDPPQIVAQLIQFKEGEPV